MIAQLSNAKLSSNTGIIYAFRKEGPFSDSYFLRFKADAVVLYTGVAVTLFLKEDLAFL